MSGEFEISKPVMKLIKQIKKNDGGASKKDVDSVKGYEQLCNLLAGNNVPDGIMLTPTERAYVNLLKTQYEEKYIPQKAENNMGVFGNGSITVMPFFITPFNNFVTPDDSEDSIVLPDLDIKNN